MDLQIGEIAEVFFTFRDNLKIYHFQTKSYARHKSSCQLEEQMAAHLDTFLETMQGSRNVRLKLPTNKIMLLESIDDKTAVAMLEMFKEWLIDDLPKYLCPTDTDLFNIRDEILRDVNQTLYLFTFK
jgi:hypothetical protein